MNLDRRSDMSRVERVPRFIWRLLRFLPPRIAYSLGLGSLVGSFVLLLKTTGRKSGLPRVTPLQYDEIDGIIYVGSARGVKADWYRNLAEDPNVEVTVGTRKFIGYADLISDSVQIADFLELRLKLHPKMVGAMLRFEGMGPTPTREQLEQYATKRALVAIRPTEDV
jgi:deazaflavin-dependent oxidoreductase (nitroreductase family)